MNRSCRKRPGVVFRSTLFMVLATCAACAMADDFAMPDSTLYAPQTDVRYGGALAESYGYHRSAGQPATITPSAGWYGYGFPVSTYRWGWFGAERYYPRVVWHRGYNGECVRWGYRSGY